MSGYTLEGHGWYGELWMSWEQLNITEKTFRMPIQMKTKQTMKN